MSEMKITHHTYEYAFKHIAFTTGPAIINMCHNKY